MRGHRRWRPFLSCQRKGFAQYVVFAEGADAGSALGADPNRTRTSPEVGKIVQVVSWSHDYQSYTAGQAALLVDTDITNVA